MAMNYRGSAIACLTGVMVVWPAATGASAQTGVVPKREAQVPFAVPLVAAARAQTAGVTVYDPAYVKITYPMGDVAAGTGVCTDVVVRAYRVLGIDLQQEIHRAGTGSGDANIDHRRVEVQRRFFGRFGTVLPVTAAGKDYRAGDIVSTVLPDGRTHIAIVSDKVAANGTPLVIHNRGFNVQEEDWLFAWKITGHYRYPSGADGEGGGPK